MIRKTALAITAALTVIVPAIASAAVNYGGIVQTQFNQQYGYVSGAAPTSVSGQPTLSTLSYLIVGYLNQALFVLMAIAIVMFVIYIIKYFIKADADRKAAGLYVLYSIIGFFVILSVWGIVNILSNTFGLSNTVNNPQSWANFVNIFPHN